MLDGTATRGSVVGTAYKDKYPAGVLYTSVTKYLAREPNIAKRKRLSSGLLKRLRAGLLLPGRYAGTHT